MRYGRRARTGHNGDVEWCELDQEEVAQVLARNVRLNAEILAQCIDEAIRLNDMGAASEPDLAKDVSLEQEVVRIALALFAQSGIKGFVALQAALEEKVNFMKETTALRRPGPRWTAAEEPNGHGDEEAVA